MGDNAIENEIQAKGKTAPRITPDHIQATIKSAHYFTAANGVIGEEVSRVAAENGDKIENCVIGGRGDTPLALLTFCVLILQNGFTVTGESACASPENFDAEIGRKIARQNAEQKIWALEGYVLKCQLADAEKDLQSAAAAQASRPTQNCVFKYCPDEADCRANGCSMGAAPDAVAHHPV